MTAAARRQLDETSSTRSTRRKGRRPLNWLKQHVSARARGRRRRRRNFIQYAHGEAMAAALRRRMSDGGARRRRRRRRWRRGARGGGAAVAARPGSVAADDGAVLFTYKRRRRLHGRRRRCWSWRRLREQPAGAHVAARPQSRRSSAQDSRAHCPCGCAATSSAAAAWRCAAAVARAISTARVDDEEEDEEARRKSAASAGHRRCATWVAALAVERVRLVVDRAGDARVRERPTIARISLAELERRSSARSGARGTPPTRRGPALCASDLVCRERVCAPRVTLCSVNPHRADAMKAGILSTREKTETGHAPTPRLAALPLA